MTVTIQIRNAPEDSHRKPKARAPMAGISLSNYLLNEVRQSAESLTLEEMKARIAALPPIELSVSVADIIREERNSR